MQTSLGAVNVSLGALSESDTVNENTDNETVAEPDDNESV
jgi:hypothetical protein